MISCEGAVFDATGNACALDAETAATIAIAAMARIFLIVDLFDVV
jgi:hypothetical protein